MALTLARPGKAEPTAAGNRGHSLDPFWWTREKNPSLIPISHTRKERLGKVRPLPKAV